MNPALRTAFLRQAGVVSGDQARRAGLSDRQIGYRVHSGEWVRVLPSVYRLSAVAPSAECSLRSASLWLGPAAALTGVGAAWWWGVVEEPPSVWQFVSRGAHLGRQPGIRVSQSFVDPDDWIERLSVPIVSRPLAVLRAAVELERVRPGQGITLIDRAKQRRLVGQWDLERAFRRHHGTWGTPAMRRLLDRTGDRAHSELERLAVSILRAAGITGFETNWRTRLSSGRPVEIDLAFPRRRLAIELDGYAFHSSPEAHRADVRRANEMMADGWIVRRFTYSDLLDDPEGFIQTVLGVLAA